MGRSREAGRATNLTYEEIFNEYAIAGDPQECIDRLAAFREMFQCQGFMFWFNIGGLLPREEVDKSMGLFAEKVMSHFQGRKTEDDHLLPQRHGGNIVILCASVSLWLIAHSSVVFRRLKRDIQGDFV